MKKIGNLLLNLAVIVLIIYLIFPNITNIITKPYTRELYERGFFENKQFDT